MDDNSLLLENQLCFPLYAAAKEVLNRYKPMLDEIGLTYTQYIVMMVLWEDKQLSVSGLGERLHLDSGTLTPLLKRLEAGGLVERRRDPDDERRVIVALTDKGRALREQAVAIPEKLFCALDMPLEAITALRERLKTLAR